MASDGTAASFQRILKYAYRFGPIGGMRTLRSVMSHKGCVQLRLAPYPAPLQLRPGTSDVPTFEKIFISQEYEFPYPAGKPGLIIDAGANVGYASIFFAKKFPSSRILAVEPERSNYELLLRNIAAYPNVTAVRAALWNKKTSLHIQNPTDEHWAFRIAEAQPGDSDRCDSITVPELMALAGVDTVDILKVDIEGAEKELFESDFEPWLDKVGVIVIELHDWLRGGCSTSFYRATSRLQFKQSCQGENIVLVKDE
jgi:FkbM family methyltransferase